MPDKRSHPMWSRSLVEELIECANRLDVFVPKGSINELPALERNDVQQSGRPLFQGNRESTYWAVCNVVRFWLLIAPNIDAEPQAEIDNFQRMLDNAWTALRSYELQEIERRIEIRNQAIKRTASAVDKREEIGEKTKNRIREVVERRYGKNAPRKVLKKYVAEEIKDEVGKSADAISKALAKLYPGSLW